MMLKRSLPAFLLIMALVGAALPAYAQGTPQPQRVTLNAPDGLTLVGTFASAPESGSAPAVLLLHMLGSNKESWGPLTPTLLDAGYAVLAVDMRGHGETGGPVDWPKAEQDVQLWIDWLRTQPGVDMDRVSLVGASIGSNLALRGMANDPGVVTAVALSPGLDYRDVTTSDAVQTIGTRPVFLVAAHGDAYSDDSVKQLGLLATGDTLIRLYGGSAHGTALFAVEDDLAPLIVNWLDAQS